MNNALQIGHLRPRHYTTIGATIANSGYNNPATDSDIRQKEIWEYIIKNNLPVRIVHGYDFTNMAPQDNEYYKYFQARRGSENKEVVDQYFKEFYEDNEPMKRIPMGFEIDGELYCGVGNHRSRAHKKGIENGYESKGSILIIGDNLTSDQKLKHGLAIATLSNRKNNDITQGEDEDDIKHQCRMTWDLECQHDPAKTAWIEEEKIKWARTWIEKNKYGIDTARISRMANEIFSSDRGQTIPMPETSEIAKNWKRFWPRQIWDPDNQKTIIQKSIQGHDQRFKSMVLHLFEVRPNFTPKRDEMWAAIRIGRTFGADISSLSSLLKERLSFLSFLEKYNTNANYEGAGFPALKQILFVKQTDHSDYEAYPWNPQTEKFDKIP